MTYFLAVAVERRPAAAGGYWPLEEAAAVVPWWLLCSDPVASIARLHK